MSVSEDLINFDIIETHKENIQLLASGRSAKALASTFAPTSRSSAPTPGDTRNLNDAIREEYEIELKSLQDSDDPLDIYDRYLKWTLGAYPSAQATPESQLRPLLERSTKAFQSVSHYRNDPRYLKMWLHYIRFFSDAPRETFAYLSRHNIGENLALFYEDFAAWLESAGRWKQADEVYKLGIDREARPADRLVRKFGEFQKRYEARVIQGDEPSSPALPTVRPALAAKVDPFAISTPTADQQAPRPSNPGISSSSRNGRHKLTIFSDNEGPTHPTQPSSGEGSRGWDSIGTIAERKKENVMEARPWTGETLKATRKPSAVSKMAVFKDEAKSHERNTTTFASQKYADHEQGTNPRTGRVERNFVPFNIVYPNENDWCKEMSFDELRAKARGWLQRDWKPQCKHSSSPKPAHHFPLQLSPQISPKRRSSSGLPSAEIQQASQPLSESQPETTIIIDINKDGNVARPKKLRLKEIKGETQTIKTNLESPTGPKLRRKHSADATMTLHTKAATDDILDIFNQPLRSYDPMAGPAESDGETDCDDDDDYTSAGESTGTGRISGTSDFEDTEPNIKTTTSNATSAVESISPWSDFTTSKHVPIYNSHSDESGGNIYLNDERLAIVNEEAPSLTTEKAHADDYVLINTSSPRSEHEDVPTKYIPIPPEDYEPPAKYQRDPAIVAQNRLPFMTPIIEKTETSMGTFSIPAQKDYFNLKTPSRNDPRTCTMPLVDTETLSSPFQEIVNESKPTGAPKIKSLRPIAIHEPKETKKEPIIQDAQCNPVHDSIRQSILGNIDPPLSSYSGFHDRCRDSLDKAPEIRKFIKSQSKAKPSERTIASLSLPPVLHFAHNPAVTYTVRRELGKGAFAPVYLAEEASAEDEDAQKTLVAVKSEHPPTAWEFYIMSTLRQRLTSNHRALASLLRPFSLHLFKDEGYLIEEYLDQGTLLDLVNLAKSDPVSGQTTLDESVAMFFTVELLRTVEAMHSIGILHGDLKADNCLVRLDPLGPGEDNWSAQYQPDGSSSWSSKGLTLIDFGRSIDMTCFRPDVQFIADWKTGKQDCIEMRELRPWTFQVDYYGIAGVVHSLLFGRYIEDMLVDTKDEGGQAGGLGERKKYRIREGLKRYWQTELWTKLFDLTLNSLCHVQGEEKARLPCMKALQRVRKDMEKWLMHEGGRRNGGLKTSLIRLEGRIRERKGR